MVSRSPSRLHRVVARLLDQHGRQAPPPANTGFALVLWEKVAISLPTSAVPKHSKCCASASDFTPEAVLAANPSVLREIAAVGGKVEIDKRAQNMQVAAAMVIDEFGGSLDDVLRLRIATPCARCSASTVSASPGRSESFS